MRDFNHVIHLLPLDSLRNPRPKKRLFHPRLFPPGGAAGLLHRFAAQPLGARPEVGAAGDERDGRGRTQQVNEG